ncbi:NAD(P)H-binding protein [Dactylosporangium sp. NPDC051485]|uniref:SDR family oxidoreductase n=1 Tax=Dactylosporangium sp. NPDC051485 TaxID=3154846 RepID=UPI00344524B6
MIVVTGATGNVGRPLVAGLVEAGAEVTAVSRNAPDVVPRGARHIRADLADPGSLAAVLDGAEAFYLLVSGAGAHLDGRAIVETVKAAGVRRIVLQSSQAAGTRPDAVSHAPLRALEDVVKDSGMDWTILRPGGFASNAYAWVPSVRAERAAYAPYASVALPIVDPDDIAAVAAAGLLDGRHAGQTYVLTGPEATTPPQRAAAIGEAIGAPVRFVEQAPEEARAQMLGFMPEPVADGTLEILGRPTAQERAVSPDVERVLGRKAGSFAQWARRNAGLYRAG